MDSNEFNVFSKSIGMLPIPGARLVSTALGLGSSIYDAIFGGTKRTIDPEVKKRLLKQESMADKLKMQSENQGAVAEQQKTDVRQNMEGALLSSGGKAANTYRSDSNIPMQAIMTAVRSQAPIAGAITQGITGATTEAENRKAQLTGEAGQMYGQIAQETEQLTREYPKVSAWDTTMKGIGASGLYNQLFSDSPDKTTNENNQPLTRPITEGNPEIPNNINQDIPTGNEFIDKPKTENFFEPSGPRNTPVLSDIKTMDFLNPEEMKKNGLLKYMIRRG